jgi:predicted pyridoxine 5'-phosphate oxidase superfamily flavin-nucleotide-binding protein
LASVFAALAALEKDPFNSATGEPTPSPARSLTRFAPGPLLQWSARRRLLQVVRRGVIVAELELPRA